MNEGCITNLPYESVVEVPCYVDGNGISIPKLGDLPLGCAAVCSQSIWVQKLAVEAAVHGDVSLLKQAALMDPLTGAVCNPPEIWQMIDEMLVAQEEWLPQYKEGIEAAKTNLKEHYVTPRCEGYKGAAVVRENCRRSGSRTCKKKNYGIRKDEIEKSCRKFQMELPAGFDVYSFY